MPTEKPDLELCSTKELVDELRRRSQTFFCITRPMASNRHSWEMYWGVDGNIGTDAPESLARVLGLVEIGKAHLLNHHEDGHEETT